jgi:predicted PurR-regulated permease PerM
VKDNITSLPFYARASILVIGLVAFTAVLYIGRSIIVPIVFAVIIAVLLLPVVNFIVRRKINRVVAIIITLFLSFTIIAALGFLVVGQISRFSESFPELVIRFTEAINNTIYSLSAHLDINPQKVYDWVTKTTEEIINKGGDRLGETLVNLGNLLVVLFLIPVYVFMILFYQPLLLDFIRKVFGEENRVKVDLIVNKTKTVIQLYLVGLVIEAILVAILNTSALLILGIDYAILLGILGALLNMIPYIGGIIAVGMYMAIALVTKSPASMIYVLAVYSVIQFIDNNYIVPKIVASKVRLNALFSIIVVFIGNALWGIPGMFLSIPLLAIVKLIFDNIEGMEPVGFLFGDTMPPILKTINLGLKKSKPEPKSKEGEPPPPVTK